MELRRYRTTIIAKMRAGVRSICQIHEVSEVSRDVRSAAYHQPPPRAPGHPAEPTQTASHAPSWGAGQENGVGMAVADHPLHRSGRAAFPHPAPTLGDNASPHQQRAARRTRSSALGVPCVRLCVRDTLRWSKFPLATPLPSATSAVGVPTLFGASFGTIGVSDFLRPSILGVRLMTSRDGLRILTRRQTKDLPVSA